MARGAHDFELDPVIAVIEEDTPSVSFEDWLQLVASDEPVNLGVPAATLLAEARTLGEV